MLIYLNLQIFFLDMEAFPDINEENGLKWDVMGKCGVL
jgi:hypothetical protein